jgi:hypothetical protein
MWEGYWLVAQTFSQQSQAAQSMPQNITLLDALKFTTSRNGPEAQDLAQSLHW